MSALSAARPAGDSALSRAVAYALLLPLAAFFALPFLWMVSTAFKWPAQIYVNPPVWIPSPITLTNFQGALALLPWPLFVRNTLIITVLSVLGALLSSSLVGFAFASLPARGKRLWFALLLATMMIPSAVTLIPTFILFSRLGWVNTWLPLIAPKFFVVPFFAFMFRQFFQTLPRDLYDSAEMDGCTPLGVYGRLALPLSRPALATAAIFAVLGSWNDFVEPLIYLHSTARYTLALGIAMFQGQHYTQLHFMMPVALLAMLPVLVLFFLAQRYFVQGIVTSGLKL